MSLQLHVRAACTLFSFTEAVSRFGLLPEPLGFISQYTPRAAGLETIEPYLDRTTSSLGQVTPCPNYGSTSDVALGT